VPARLLSRDPVTPIDAREVAPGTTIDADLCIIGSGAAGMTVALQLDGSAQSVCLVESGGEQPDEDTQALYELDAVGYPVRQNFMSRARYFGGTSNLWAGRNMRMSPIDFERRDWVPHSGWPIPYEDVRRYYATADRILDLPSDETAAAVVSDARSHGVARLLFDQSGFEPTVALWAKKPVRFGTAYGRRLHASRNTSVVLHASVTSLDLDAGGHRIEACNARTLGGRAIRFRARRFVLACGGLETPRLLLASRAVQANGIGNEHDLVGRFFMDHPRSVFGRVRFAERQKLPALLGLPLAGGMAQIGLRVSDEVQARERLLNHYVTLEPHWSDQTVRAYQTIVHSGKILLRRGHAGSRLALLRARLAKVPDLVYLLAPREILPHPVYRLARRIKDRFDRGLSELVVVNYCEQTPNPLSRVSLGRECDRLGVPKLVLDWVIGPRETDSLMRFHDLLDAHLRRSRLGRLDRPSTDLEAVRYSDASHHLGTTRMSADPREGVVDVNCKVHGVENLFIAGGSVFPSAGHANPTLTIVALAVRLAEHLQETSA
jgi:choline dehydrogenase-like flavoprotein